MKNVHFLVAKKLAELLDNQFEIFGIKFGLDPIFDLIPGVGDLVASILGCYIVWVGYKLNLPQKKINGMIINVVLDFLLGLVPVVGNVGTIFFRSNSMNIRIIEDYFRNVDGTVEEGEIIG